MPTKVQYPLINGASYSWASVVLKLDGQEFAGVKSITYARHRERGVGHGTNPDPLFKTRGKNTYECEIELYLAEWKAFVLDHFGNGYGDRFFSIDVMYAESDMPTIHDRILGNTIDDSEGGGTEGTDPLTRKFKTSPLKIIFDGKDDNRTPLRGSRAQA